MDIKSQLPLPAEKGEIEYDLYVVAFIDLMGQQEQLHKVKAIPESEDDVKLAMTSLLDVSRAIYAFRAHFRTLFESFFESEDMEIPEDASPEHVKVYHQAREADIRFQRFADTVVIYMPLYNIHGLVQFRALYSLIAASGMAVISQLSGKLALRGGIELGWGCEITPGEIYGPVLSHAYRLESQHASYPRVLVGPNLMKCLDENMTQEPIGFKERMQIGGAQLCMESISTDVDSLPFIDGLKIMDSISTETEDIAVSNKIIKDGYSFICESIANFEKSQNYKLLGYYGRLKNQFERSKYYSVISVNEEP